MRLNLLAISLSCVASPICWLFCAPLALASECGEVAGKMRHGEIRWDESAIYVQGTAAPNLSQKNLTMIKRGASRAARLDAYRKAAAVLGGVTLTATESVGDVPGANSHVSGFLQGAELCDSKFYADGGVDLVLRVPMASVYTNLATDIPPVKIEYGTSEYTGMVIDVRALPFIPAMIPTLTLASGQTVLDQQTRSKTLPVRYVYSETSPLISQFTGINPLFVEATSLGTSSPSEIFLEASATSALSSKPGFLSEGQTVIVMREPSQIDCKAMTASVRETQVDWVNRLVLSRGYGDVDFSKDTSQAVRLRLLERSAEVDAERLLSLESVARATNNEHSTVQNVLVNAVRCGAKFFKDGKAEVVQAVPLDQLTFPMQWASGVMNESASEDLGLYTGLVIDARHLDGFVPTIAPSFSSSGGDLLYNSKQVEGTYGRTWGGAGYQLSVEDAMSDERTGDSPLVVVPMGQIEGSPHVLLFSEEVAEKIRQLGSQTHVLQKAALVIVLPEAG